MNDNPNTLLNALLAMNASYNPLENEAAHRASSEAIKLLVDRVIELQERLDKLETILSEGGITYRPEGYENHLNMKENYDEIYKRLGKLENGVY